MTTQYIVVLLDSIKAVRLRGRADIKPIDIVNGSRAAADTALERIQYWIGGLTRNLVYVRYYRTGL
jgi:hypothetical protein